MKPLRFGRTRRPHPGRVLATVLIAAFAAAVVVPAAAADEIVLRDLNSGAKTSLRCWRVTSESWSEVKYKERERSAEKPVPTIMVVDIVRSTKDATADNLKNAIGELDRGNYREGADALQAISGGGWKVNIDTGERKYVSFSENDPSGRNRRPPWTSEYAHFYYARAKYLHGKTADDKDALQEAFLAIEDQPVPGQADAKTGGFLGRFAGGNSRFYPEALWIKAQVLVALDKHAEAAKVFTELHEAAIRHSLGPRWAYEGKIGAGVIAEAKGNLTGAVNGYNAAGSTIEVLLKDERRKWLQWEFGRYYSLARMRVAAVKLKDAEKRKAPSAFADLRNWIRSGQPEELRKRYRNKGFSPEAVRAMVSGARDPHVQAVGLNGLGLAYLNEPKPKYEEALMAFKAVVVKYFQVPEQPARALYYLARASDGASKGKPEKVRDMYLAMKENASKTLRREFPDSEWARK